MADILHKNDYQYNNFAENNTHETTDNKGYQASKDRLTQLQTFGINYSIAIGYRF